MRWFLCALLILLGVQQAGAHAVLTGTEPQQGVVLETSPDRLVLHFMEPVSVLRMDLVLPDSVIAPLPAVKAQGHEVVVPVPPGLGRGTHLLSWRVLGQDPHPVSGVLTFSIHALSNTPALPARQVAGIETALWLATIALNFSLFAGIGGIFFRFWVNAGRTLPPVAGKAIAVALGVGLLGMIVSIPLTVLEALDTNWASLADGAVVVRIAVTTGVALKAGLVVCAVFLCAAAGRVGPLRVQRALSAAAVVLAASSIAMEGHGAPGVPQFAARAALFAHAVSLFFWVGALVPLGALLVKGQAADALRRFSQVIPAYLLLLIASGLVLISIHVRSLAQILMSDFGMVLLAKLTLFAILLAVAAHNRFNLTSRVLGGKPGTAKVLASFAGLEVALVLIIVTVAGAWRFAPPVPSQAHDTGPLTAEVQSPQIWAMLNITPGFETPRRLSFIPMQDRGTMDIDAIALRAAPANGSVAEIRRPLTRAADGAWEADGLYVPTPGPWQYRFTITTSQGETLPVNQTIFMTR